MLAAKGTMLQSDYTPGSVCPCGGRTETEAMAGFETSEKENGDKGRPIKYVEVHELVLIAQAERGRIFKRTLVGTLVMLAIAMAI